jgi:branched-chain amino acid transport system permease protein
MKFLASRLTIGNVIVGALVILVAVLPVTGIPREWILYLFLFLIYLAMANVWNLLAGYSGLLSLCPAAFLGLAGYTLAIGTWVNIPWELGMIGGIIVVAIFTVLISFPVFRLSGIYFAIGTLVVPEALRILFFLWKPVGGELQGRGAGYMIKGIADIHMSTIYWMAFGIAIASAIIMRIVLNSKLGLGLAAIRDNERTAASSGVDTFRIKLYPFIISAVVTGLAGAVFYMYQGYIEPSNTFNVKWLMIIMMAVVIGGMRSEGGPIIGTIIVTFLYFMLARYAGYSLLIQGIILVVIMLLSPQGLVGLMRNTRFYRAISKVANRRFMNLKTE